MAASGAGSELFLEDDAEAQPHRLDRWLTAMLQQPGADTIAGLGIGRFQLGSNMTREQLEQILARQSALDDVPVLTNVDFGHTNPMLTLPIVGQVAAIVGGGRPEGDDHPPQSPGQ